MRHPCYELVRVVYVLQWSMTQQNAKYCTSSNIQTWNYLLISQRSPLASLEGQGVATWQYYIMYWLTTCTEKAFKLIHIKLIPYQMSRSLWSLWHRAPPLPTGGSRVLPEIQGFLSKSSLQMLPTAALTKWCVLSDLCGGVTSHFEGFNFRFKTDFQYCDQKKGFNESFFSTKQPNTIHGRQAEWWCHTLQGGTKECACKASLNLIVLSGQNVK